MTSAYPTLRLSWSGDLNTDPVHQVREAVVQFWRGMPQQVQALLHHDVVVQVIGTCDGLLYHTMAETLIPTEIEVRL